MKNNGYFYFRENCDTGVLYDKYSGKIFRIPKSVAVNGKQGMLSENDALKINSLLSDKPICTDISNRKDLNHLRLMLTNECNFACTYCYADEGSYGVSNDNMMSNEVSLDAVKWAYSKYKNIKQISFFGGEPLLNLKVIESVCSFIVNEYKLEKIERMPLFSIVTNAYFITDEVINLFSKYNIHPVVSVDGPKKVHDKQRILKNGGGTFDVVYHNLKKFREKMPFSIEATFTTNHDSEGLTMDDVDEYLKKEFNVTRMIVNGIYTYKDGKLSHINALASKQKFDYSKYFNDFFNSENYVYNDIIVRLIGVFQKPYYLESFCDAGLTQYTIDWDGNILPCHIFTGEDEKKLGNIYDNSSLKDIKTMINTKNIEFCKDCSDRRFCQKCLLDIENDYFKCENFRNGLTVFFNNMLDLFVFDQDRYLDLVNGSMKFGKE